MITVSNNGKIIETTIIFAAVSVIDANAFSPLSRHTSLTNCVISVIPKTFNINLIYAAVESIDEHMSDIDETMSLSSLETIKNNIHPPATEIIIAKVLFLSFNSSEQNKTLIAIPTSFIITTNQTNHELLQTNHEFAE